jgi:endonuclease/exonuclease/phosphatase family metal-dependent hydrolase
LFFAALVAVLLVAASAAVAIDVPVHGARLSLRAGASSSAPSLMRFSAKDEAIGAPFADPRAGARLVLSGGIGRGQCRVDVLLDGAKWRPLEVDGSTAGYRYTDPQGTIAGIRRLTIRPGRISLRAGNTNWPCGLSATSARLPVTVDLFIGEARYCAGFGGEIVRNERNRFVARSAPAPPACPKNDVTVANLNVLHGVNCSIETRFCRLNDRSQLLFQWVEDSGCPDIVTFQEIFRNWSTLIAGYQELVCSSTYRRVYMITGLGVDDQLILSRFPVVDQEVFLLYRDFRSVTFARIDHPIGPVDVFSTHLASSADGGDDPCTGDCPPECIAAGAATVRDCQAVQVAEFVEARHDVDGPAIVTGDFNAPPGSFVYEQFTARGWLDTYLAGGNAECDPPSGAGCTSGREDEGLSDLESPESNESERIDYIFAVPPAADFCQMSVEPAGDPDGNGTSTGAFAAEPNPFAEMCGAMPLPICYPSDHQGVQADLNCPVTLP